MTISTEVRKAGPFIGNDSASVFPFAFKVFKAADLIVVRRQDNIVEETTLILDSDYHVTLNSNQDTTPGGVVTLVAGALASGFTLVVSSELPYLQTTDLTNQGGFYPKVITNALDRLTIFCQQLAEITGRTLKLPITAPTNISAEIPLPNPSELIAWNETGTGLTTVSPQSLVTSIAYGSATADLFAGDGVTTTFPLTTNPASVNNLDVSIGGHSQRPVQGGIGDYSWNGGASITFVTPPPAPTVPGDKNVLVRYMQAIPVSDSEALHAQTREALRRSYAEAGSNLVDGSFETGGTLASTTDVLLLESTGAAYAWTGALPKTVAPGFDPVGVAGFELRTDVALRGDMSSVAGAGMIGFSQGVAYSPATAGFRLKNAVYATDAPFNAPTDGSDAASHINAALTFCAANNKDMVLDRLFKIGSTVTIPANVTVICLTRQCGLDSTATGANSAVVMSGINSRLVGGTVKGINNPASTTIRQDGVLMASTSSFCELVDVHVYGFFAKNFTGPGAGVGISDRGVSNKIKSCRAIDSKFCVSLGGKKGEVVSNYISNRFLTQTVESKPWTSASNYWDGLVSEGIEDYLIAFNHVTECGQSGIYTGGNGGLSKSNRIIGNLVEKCWNRGIDQGVSAAQSASNDVIGQNIVGNICRNNRENNIWLAGTTRCNVSANTSIYDAEYAALFTGYYGGHTGIALTNGAVGTVPFGNSIIGNNCYDSESYPNISISCGVTATGNTVDGNTIPQGTYLVGISLYATNNFDFIKAPTFTPTLIGGSGTITLSSATGSTNIKGRRVSFNLTITVGSVSTPSGQLLIGYIPPLSGTTARFTDVKVVNYGGLDSTIGNSQLVAYMAGDQVNIARVNNGTRTFDMRAFLKAGSTITVSGEVEFYA